MLFSVVQILERVREIIAVQPIESIKVEEGLGRVLAEDIHSSFSLPPVDLAAVDGYAVRSSDVMQIPVALMEAPLSDSPEIGNGETIEIHAGAPIPKGADAVISLDVVDVADNMVTVNSFVNEGKNVSVAGVDIDKDTTILKKGTVINVRIMALLSAMQIPWLPVRVKPRVGILVGDMQALNSREKATNMSSSLGLMVHSFITAIGGIPVSLGDIKDVLLPHDMSVASRGVSIDINRLCQDVDIVLAIGSIFSLKYSYRQYEGFEKFTNMFWDSLIEQDAILEMYRTRIGEKESVILGKYQDTPIFGLPCSLSYGLIKLALFLRPTISHMLGIEEGEEKHFAVLSRNLDLYDRSRDYLHAKFVKDEQGNIMVAPFSAQDLPMLSSLAESDCLIVLGDDPEALKLGSKVEVLPFSGSLMSI